MLKRRYWSAIENLRRVTRLAHAFVARRRGSIVALSGVKVRLSRQIPLVISERLLYGGYEAQERRLVEASVTKEDTVLELGTGLGVLAVLCAQRVGAHRVHTYEANPALLTSIRDTFDLNGLSPQLSLGLVGPSSGEGKLFVAREFWRSTAVPTALAGKPTTVPMVSLEDLLNGIQPTVMIMDVEGGEYELLLHSTLLGVRKVIIELHPHIIGSQNCDQVMDRLRFLGFNVNDGSQEDNCFLLVR